MSDTHRSVPNFVVDLDRPVSIRWKEICESYDSVWKKKLKPYVKGISKAFGEPEEVLAFVETIKGIFSTRKEYRGYVDEIVAISRMSSALTVDELVLLHFMYEATQGCTAILALEERTGKAVIGRTMDWSIPVLQELTIQVHFRRGGRILFTAPTWAGYVGILTAVRPKDFAVAVNFRLSRTELADRMRIPRASPIGFIVRHVMETCDTYDSAVRLLAESPLLARAFFTICDAESSGCVLSRTPTGEDARQVLGPSAAKTGITKRKAPFSGRQDGKRGKYSGGGAKESPGHRVSRYLVQANLAHWVDSDREDVQESLPRTRLVHAYVSERKRRLASDGTWKKKKNVTTTAISEADVGTPENCEARLGISEIWDLLGTYPIWESGYSVYASVLSPFGIGTVETRTPKEKEGDQRRFVFSETRILPDRRAENTRGVMKKAREIGGRGRKS